MVEVMEENLKRDVIREVRAGEGRILLHDEVEERPGVFKIIPIWEQVDEQDIMTPRDVYNLMVQEGYKVRPQLPLYSLRMVDFSMNGVLAGRLWPGCSGTLSCSSPVSRRSGRVSSHRSRRRTNRPRFRARSRKC